jgi:nucleotide-binding universal stress UspA family protein
MTLKSEYIMNYKTILVHVDASSRCPTRIKIAAQITNQSDAHLVGVAVTGVSRYIYEGSAINANDPNLGTHLDWLKQRALTAAEQFAKLAPQLGVASFESAVTHDEANGGLALRARYSDLLVLGQSNADEPSPSVLPDFPECMVLESGRPVLIIPAYGEFSDIGKRPLIAWDGSREASRALTDAIPLLRNAELVHIAVINPNEIYDRHGEQAGSDIALYLSRHGINIEISTHETVKDVGHTLLRLCRENKSDLLIMGGYGHSRFREMILGGTTQTILKEMDLPVLMSH